MSAKRILLLAAFFVLEICVYAAFIGYNVVYMEREVNDIIAPLIIIAVILSAVYLLVLYYPMLGLFQRGRDYTQDVFNNVEWRWQWLPAGPVIKGAFCTKCGGKLTPVKAAESWQADLKCSGCGRTYVSFPGGANESGRTFEETQKLVTQTIIKNAKQKGAKPQTRYEA